MRRTVLLAATLLAVAGCGGTSEADQDICASQAADLEPAHAVLADLSDGTGQIQTAKPALGDAVSTLTGYVAEDTRLDRAVTQARDDVEAMYDDVLDQRIEDQSVATAQASLDALADTCASLD